MTSAVLHPIVNRSDDDHKARSDLIFPIAISATTRPLNTVDSVMSPYVYVFYASFIVAFIFTPILRQVALYYGVIDRPDLVRKLHREPVAYLGGVAVFLGWLAGLAMSQLVHDHRPISGFTHLRIPMSVLGAAAIIVVLGLVDDFRKVPPWVKICTQIIAALSLLHGGVGAHSTEPLLHPVMIRVQHYFKWSPDWYNAAIIISSSLLTIVLVVGCCNATNLMDGLDGLCGGVTAIIAAAYVFMAVAMACHGTGATTNIDGLRVVLGLALLGGSLGFVPFNFNPASIFLGDTGSMFIGFSFATLIAMFAEENPKWLLAALIVFALPILDTSLAFARRYVNGRPLFSADRHHFHHQLVARGFSVRQTVIISYGLSICFAALGVAIVFMRTRYAVAIYMVVFGCLIVAAYKIGMVHEKAAVTARQGLDSPQSNSSLSGETDPSQVLRLSDEPQSTRI